MYQVGQDDQGRQHGGQVLLAMAVVMLKVVALGLEGIVVFVLDFPSAAARRNDRDHAVGSDPVRGGPAVAVEHPARGVSGREFTPVDVEGIVAVA